MKKIVLILLFLFLYSYQTCQSEVYDFDHYTAVTSLLGTDLMLIERDPVGTPSFKKITWTNFLSLLTTYNNLLYQPKISNLTTWSTIYTNGSGVLSQLTLGSSGSVLTSTGATSIPVFIPSGFVNILTKATPYELGTVLVNESYNYTVLLTDTALLTLKSAVLGMSVRVVVKGTKTGSVKPATGEVINLRGTDLAINNKISSSGAASDFIELVCLETSRWYTLSERGPWVDGGL